MPIKQSFKELFHFTTSERRGIVVLLILLAVVIALRLVVPHFKPQENDSEVQIEYVELIAPKVVTTQKKEEARSEVKIVERKIDRLTKFDPNKASFEELLSFGFSEFAAKNLIKYRLSGGEFSSAQDLSRIYGVDTSLIAAITDQVIIVKEEEAKNTVMVTAVVVELNASDTTQLKTLPCIGAVISTRIIKYRKLLGGFQEKEQLLEVYGIDDNCYQLIANRVQVNKVLVQKINLNEATEEDLARHPYITKYQARAIVKYRELMGPFTDLEALIHNHIFTKAQYQKVKHYFEKIS